MGKSRIHGAKKGSGTGLKRKLERGLAEFCHIFEKRGEAKGASAGPVRWMRQMILLKRRKMSQENRTAIGLKVV